MTFWQRYDMKTLYDGLLSDFDDIWLDLKTGAVDSRAVRELLKA